ncbi:MAG: OmpA family protein [Deltaproteobacteria bacterium]|nr:OmpA family protein [Deltaproteobacteria bacterium]
MRSLTTFLSFSALAATLGVTCLSGASECNNASRLSSCINSDTLWPHAGAATFQSVGATETTATGQFSFGIVTTYLRKPIVLRASSPDPAGTEVPAVNHLVDSSFLWAFGVTNRLELTFAMPASLYQTGSGLSGYTSSHATPIPATAVRDLRYGLAYALVPRDRAFPTQGFAATARFEMSAPVGDRQSFAGDRSAVWYPTVSADYRIGRVFVGAELGARLRGTSTLAGTRVGSQLFSAVGVGFDILPEQKLSAAIEAFALPTLVGQEQLRRDPTTAALVAESSTRKLVPAEWMATVRTAPIAGGDFSVAASGGTALPLTDPSSMTSPSYRFVLGVRYAPLARDTDGDGVLDRDDKCPAQKEDRDGFEDDDGCVDPDNDRDGIPDELDRCRDKPEDHDGFKDDDGCPDLDDDGDGVPDADDQCRNKAEDKDGFEDSDGCPDPDNDGDGILDKDDKCPNAPEDFDGYNDQDGCPDPDNDMDGIPDKQDKCPNTREDKDGFQDEDGCPEPDNDQDGISDDLDKCPLQAETINGVDDNDGCPEPGAKELTVVDGAKVSVQAPARFAPNQARMTPQMQTQLLMIAQRARGMVPVDRVIIEAFADAPGDTPATEKLAADRSESLRAVFIQAGFPATMITAASGDLAAKRPATAPQYEVTVQRSKYK